MPRYLRPRLPGTPIFFTVTLAQRGNWRLAHHIDTLREAVRVTRAERPFAIAAWVVLPDHLHCTWHLPEGDCDYLTRWRLIKSRFSRGLPVGELRDSHIARQERGIWQRSFWGETRPEDGSVDRFQRRTREGQVAKAIISAMNAITPHICGIVGSIR